MRLSPTGQKALFLKLSSPVGLRSFPRVSTDADELKVVDMIGEKSAISLRKEKRMMDLLRNPVLLLLRLFSLPRNITKNLSLRMKEE